MGTQDGGQYADKRKVLIAYELVDETADFGNEEEETFVLSKRYTYSMGTKSNLRKDIESILGGKIEIPEDGFDVEEILGTACQIQVLHEEGNNGKTYPNIKSIMKAKGKVDEGMQEQILLSLEPDEFDEEEFELLPEWLQNAISDSPEHQELTQPKKRKAKRNAKKVADEEDEEPATPAPRRRKPKAEPEDDLPFDDEDEAPEPPRRRRKRR
jgi:hypothetical protein